MTAYKIGGPSFRPAQGVSKSKKPAAKPDETGAAPVKSGLDSMEHRANPLAVMPRMSGVGAQTAQHVQGGTVESMLRDQASELDDYFSGAYGFKE